MRVWTGISAILVAFSTTRLALTSSIEYPKLNFVKSVTQNEDTKTAIDRLSSVSRIITAVYILRGLSDASVPADAVISELLNLGSINLASLENFDKTKVDEFIDKLKSTNMAGNGKTEKGIIDMKTIKESWMTWTKAPELPDNAAYAELAKIKSLDVSALKSNIPIVEDSNKKLKQFSSLSDQDVASLKNSLKSVTDALNSVKGNTDLKNTVGLLTRWKKLSSMVHIFQLYDNLPRLNVIRQNEEKELISNIDALKNLESLKSGPIFEAINSIISSRFIFHPTDRQQTSGFVNGFEDMSKLENDVKDEWVTNLFAAYPNLDKVLTLATLNAPMVSLDSKWKSSATQSIYTSMKQVDRLRTLLETVSNIPSNSEVTSELSSLKNCFSAHATPATTNVLIPSMNSVGTLSRKIIAFNDIEALSQQNKVAGIINQLSKNTNPDDVKKLEEFFVNLEPKLKILTDGNNIKDDVEKIESSSGIVTDFQKDVVILEYETSFKCFAETDFEKLVTSVRITTQVRNIKSTKVLDDVKAAAAAVAGTTENLKEVRESVTSVARKEESKALEDMDGLKKYSKPFGDAVNALVSIMMASTKGNEFETMLLKGSLVEGAVGAAKNTDVEAKFRKDWGNFAETVNQVSKLFGAIREWQNGLSISKDGKFDSMDIMFSNLAGLTDVNLQTEKRLAAVESDNVNVIPNIKTLRDDFIKDLLVVSKLDLQFSRFKSAVANMPETMKQVSGVLNGGNSTSVETSTAVAFTSEYVAYLIGTLLLAFTVVMGFLCCLNCCGMRTWAKNKLCTKKPKKSGVGGKSGKGGRGGNGGDGGKSGEKDDRNSKNTTSQDKTKTTPSHPNPNNTDANARTGGHQVAGQNRADQPEVPPRADQRAPGPSRGAGAPGGAVRVSPVGAPPPNALPNGGNTNQVAQPLNNQRTSGRTGSTNSTARDNTTDNGTFYYNDGRLPLTDPRRNIPTRPSGISLAGCTGGTGNETLDDVVSNWGNEHPKND